MVKSPCFRHIHKLSFLWNFGYLAFFRTTPYFAIAPISPLSNAIQLILTLKVSKIKKYTTLAYYMTLLNAYFRLLDWLLSYATQRTKKLTDLHKSHTCSFQNLQCLMSSATAIHISGSLQVVCAWMWVDHISLILGPIYTYRTFKDMVNDEQSHKVAVGASIKSRLKLAPLAAVTFLVTSHFFKLDVRNWICHQAKTVLLKFVYF